MTDVYGILGHPVGHSLSPAMHNRAFAALGIDALYVPFAVAPDRLVQAVASIRPLNLRGVNITLPHKTTIMALLDRIEPDAQAIGAVNTLFHDGDKIVGMNTDAPGLQRALEEAGLQLTAARVAILGAGGAARASVIGLARAGAAEICVCARRPAEAEALVLQLTAASGKCKLSSCALDPAALSARFGGIDLLVQASSATLEGAAGAEAFSAALPLGDLPSHAGVVDLVYRPRETSLLRAARERGLRAVDGLGMLLHQGAIAFEKWTGRQAPLAAMRSALEE
jgi:shikimate dehydrogenase